MTTLMERYVKWNKGDASHDRLERRLAGKELPPVSMNEMLWHREMIDFRLRTCIGKTNNIKTSLCSHDAIVTRELGEGFCRVCHRQLNFKNKMKCVARYNDYLVIRNKRCPSPICLDCAKNNPDEFHKAFKKGLKAFKTENKLLRGI